MRRDSVVLLTLTLALALIGVFVVYSASAVDPNSAHRLQRQLIYLAIGFTCMYIAAHFDYTRLRDPWVYRGIVAVSILLLIAVLIPGVGAVHGGARRWIEIGSFSFQPSEFAKFALLLLLAVKLSANQEHVKSFRRGLLPSLAITTPFMVLIVCENDLGSPAVLFAAAMAMIFVAGTPWRYLIPSLIPAFAVLYALTVTSPYRVRRLTAFVDPWSHSDDDGYQLIQSLAAFAQGGVWGRGPGAGEQKLHYLPAAPTDFIFAVWAEEMGLVGSLALTGLFVALMLVAVRIALNASDLFGTLLGAGIVSLVTIQASVNIGVATGLLPTKGLPLPFVSWGGSSLILFMGLMGLLMSIGLRGRAPAPRTARA